jgi:hypothetical protein
MRRKERETTPAAGEADSPKDGFDARDLRHGWRSPSGKRGRRQLSKSLEQRHASKSQRKGPPTRNDGPKHFPLKSHPSQRDGESTNSPSLVFV